MTDDALSPHGDRWTVRLERRLAHPVDRVWRALTEPDHVAQWFPVRIDGEWRPGAPLRFGDEATPGGEVLGVDPPRRLAFTWGDNELHLELEPDGDGTTLRLRHVFDDRPGAASFATGWHQCLAALAAVVAGDPLPAPDRDVARHEALAARFGLGEPTITEADGTWTVRFERQLVCPAEVAWDLFLGRDPATGDQRTAPAVGEPLTPYAAPEVVLGTVTQVDPPRLLAFDAAGGEPGDHVRLELVDGTGHGARLVLTVTGPADRPEQRDAAVTQWGAGAVEEIAAGAAAWATAPSAS